jgi:uncharacterized membrane protein
MQQSSQKISAIDGGEVSTARLETLTDGIFAIAMTILVLNIHLPELFGNVSAGELFVNLTALWPTLASFVVSFVILGMFWVAHHTEFRYIKKMDNTLIWQNLFYLLLVALLPFSAALLGKYPENRTSAIIYALHLIFMVLLQYFMWRHARSKPDLMATDLHPNMDRLVNRVAFAGIIAYIIAIAFSFWNVNISLIIYALVPLPYIFGWIYNLA